MTEDELTWHTDHPALPDVMGVNYYPAHSTELLEPQVHHEGGPRDLRPRVNHWTSGLADVLTTFAQRYDRPVFLTETCLTGTVEDRIRWMNDSIACVRQLRTDGVPVVGYTWWSLFDMYDWNYRTGSDPLESYRLPMGLWDLVEDDAGRLLRQRSAAADRFRHHAATFTDPHQAASQQPTSPTKEP